MLKVTIYEQPNCVQCKSVKRRLDKAGVAYETAWLPDHQDLARSAIQKGFTSAPIVTVTDGDETLLEFGGYRPDYIKTLLDIVSE